MCVPPEDRDVRVVRSCGRRPEDPADALNLWLARGLQQNFGSVLKEPVPEELVRLLGGKH